jgi:hypothetical protein
LFCSVTGGGKDVTEDENTVFLEASDFLVGETGGFCDGR